MPRCYSETMQRRQPLPMLWLVSDARNDAGLEQVLRDLPRSSGFIYRHYHLPPSERRARFDALKRVSRAQGHVVVLSGSAAQARHWGADGAYGDDRAVARGPAMFRLVTAHSLRDLRRAKRADGVLLSPVFATRSHPAVRSLGTVRFRLLARQTAVPVIALGGIDMCNSRALRPYAWAAIDGLSNRRRRALCAGRSNR